MNRLWRVTLAFVLAPAPLCLAQSTPSYTITTVAGNNSKGYSGDGGAATSAQLGQPTGVAVDRSGNIYIADQVNNAVREVTTDGNIKTIAGNNTAGYSGDNGSATSAALNNPVSVALDSSGAVYISDYQNDVIRKFIVGGSISTVAGSNSLYLLTGYAYGGYSGDGGPATNALLNLPFGIALDPRNGDLYLADTNNQRIRKVDSNGNITTVAGNGTNGSADTGAALQAHLNAPRGVAVDANGNLYIADTGNNKILKLSGGTLTTLAGTGIFGSTGDNGPATAAKLFAPRGVAVDTAGNVYIADYSNHRIRMVSTGGIITTIAGNGRAGYSGDGGAATSAQLNFPSGVAVDASGNVYVADTQNDVIRKLVPSSGPGGGGTPPSIRAQAGVISAGGFGGFSAVAPGSWIEIYGSNLAPAGDSRSWTDDDFSGANKTDAPTSLDRTTVSIGGQAAYVAYISPDQVNAQVPFNVGLGPEQVTVSTAAGTSAPYTVTVNQTQPGLLALPAFNIGGKQYAVATFTDLTTFVAPVGAIAGYTSRPAKPGETIVLYGVGFGPVTGNIPAGQKVQQQNSLTTPLQILLGNTPGVLNYWGLAPTVVGLYQFNVVVPAIGAGDAVPLSFTLGTPGVPGSQTLYTAIQN